LFLLFVSFILLKYLCVVFIRTLHKYKCYIKIVCSCPEEVCGLSGTYGGSHSEHEVEGISLLRSVSSVGDLGGFSSGVALALDSDSLTALVPVSHLDIGGGTVVVGSVGVGLALLEAELARGTLSHDASVLVNLRLEEGLSDGVQGEGSSLGKDVEGLELNVNRVIKVTDLHLGTHGMAVLVVVEYGVGLDVLVHDEGEHLHEQKEENTHGPDNDEHLRESMEEGVQHRPGPSTDGEGPEEGHNEPSDDADVEADPGSSSLNSVERHLVPRGVDVFDVLALVNVHVVDNVENGEGTVDGPTHVS